MERRGLPGSEGRAAACWRKSGLREMAAAMAAGMRMGEERKRARRARVRAGREDADSAGGASGERRKASVSLVRELFCQLRRLAPEAMEWASRIMLPR
jgi:hypothetical protein